MASTGSETRVSVFIPTFNSERTIGSCLESLSRQTYKNFEVILADAFSTDKTPKIASEYGSKTVSSKGLPGASINQAAKHATGTIFVYINSDGRFEASWLEKITASFQKEKNLGCLCGSDRIPDTKFLLEKTGGAMEASNTPQHSFSDVKKVVFKARGCNMAFTRKAFEKISGFDARLFGLEEGDLCYRIAKAGFKVKYDPAIWAYHGQRCTLSSLYSQFRRNGSGDAVFQKKYGFKLMRPTEFFVLLWPFAIAGLAALSPYSVYSLLAAAGLTAGFLLSGAIKVFIRTRSKYSILVPVVSAVRLIGFTMGFYKGLLKGRVIPARD